VAVPSIDSLLAEGGGLRGRTVFLRADLNVPLDERGVADDTRIRAALPTLRQLLAAGARVVLASHLGRPKGEPRPELSLRPVAARLAGLLGRGVSFCEQIVGETAKQAVGELRDGELLLLENLRFHPGETKNDPDFARALASLADVYVNDAFGTAHRAHASTVGIVQHLERYAAGGLLHRELEQLRVIREPERPLLCLLGGAKVSDKIAVLEALAPHADLLAVGGGDGLYVLARVGPSDGRLPRRAGAAGGRAPRPGGRREIPTDHVVVREIAPGAESEIRSEIPDGWIGVDIGPESAARYAAEAGRARTIFWNGPMGVFEIDAFAQGTEAVARAVADSDARSVVGGGDSLAAVNRLGLGERIGHLSTGGGASLEYVQGRTLPGVAALES
jgi:phosphoglycerate kinase